VLRLAPRFVSGLVINLFRLLWAPFFLFGKTAGRPRSKWVHIRLRPRLVEIERPLPALLQYIPGFADALPTSLTLIRRLVGYLLEDSHIEGVVFDVPPLRAGWATTQSLRAQIERLRKGGKKTVVYLSQGGGNKELWVATAAERILATPSAQLATLGIGASVTYYKGLLDKAGLEVEVKRRAEYKTAVEPAVREEMSEEQREQLDALLGHVDDALREGLASRPQLDEEKVDALFERALIGAPEALERGVLDAVCYEDELPTALTDDDGTTALVRAPRYFAWRSAELLKPMLPGKFIAVVPITGAIPSSQPGTRGGLQIATTLTTLRLARKNPQVAGVVLQVDSPGGSAFASDLIHREVVRLKEKKPVVASMGDVAASGGYYVSAPADYVVAQPLTITGSIGVVSARLVTEPLLEKWGIHTSTVRRAPHADLFTRPGRLDESEDAILDREIGNFYDTFVGIVAEGRGRPADEVEPLARGRVWSGQDAMDKGLVDELGGLDVAIEQVRKRAGGDMNLEARWYRARRPLDLPPAEPATEKAARAILGSLDPRLAEMFSLAVGARRSGERVLCYAPDLPEIH
jgi:protease-4